MSSQITGDRLTTLFRPRSVALVGASDKSTFSILAYNNLVQFGFSERTAVQVPGHAGALVRCDKDAQFAGRDPRGGLLVFAEHPDGDERVHQRQRAGGPAEFAQRGEHRAERVILP